MSTLRDQVIKLAHDNPGRIRNALLPILKKRGSRTAGTGVGQDVYKLFPRNSYLYRYFEETDLPYRTFKVTDSTGVEHTIPNEVVLQFMAQTGPGERKKIEDTIRQIDFRAGDVNHFLQHLAKALAEQYAGVLR